MPGLIKQLEQTGIGKSQLATSLLASGNSHIPESDLLRLFTAIALATWGQQIGTY